MKLATLALYALTAFSQASPLEERNNKACISDSEAQKLLAQFVTLFENIDVNLAKKILVPDFQQYSASINFLIAQQGGLTSSTRDQFIKQQQSGQANRPPTKFLVLDADHTCNRIYFRWKTDGPEVTSFWGFDQMNLVKKADGWKVQKDYSEFNNAIVLFNAGLFPCNANNTPTPGT